MILLIKKELSSYPMFYLFHTCEFILFFGYNFVRFRLLFLSILETWEALLLFSFSFSFPFSSFFPFDKRIPLTLLTGYCTHCL